MYSLRCNTGKATSGSCHFAQASAAYLRAHQADVTLRRFTEHPPPKEQALMPTFPDKEAAKHISRPARKQPSPDPRLQPSASAIANRAAEVGTLFSKPGNSIS